MLSIIVPVRNETDVLKDVFTYFSRNSTNLNYEVLIINDFSEDDTLNKAKSLINEYQHFKVFNNKKKGLGGAINLGIKEASGTYVTIMMADQSDDINDLIQYNKLMKEENYDAILGSRFLNSSKVTNYPLQKLILNRSESLILVEWVMNFFVPLLLKVSTPNISD